MKSPALSTALLGLALACTLQPTGARAGSESVIQRCEGADGTAIYTDKGCGSFRAQPTRMSDDLHMRIAMADAGNYADAGIPLADEAPAMGAYRDAAEPLSVAMPGRRSASAGCARSPEQLSRDLVGAFALHDVNRVAESYHWAGMSQRQATPVMKQLERLSAQPLADARFLAAWIGSGERAAASMPTDAGLMQLVFAGGTRVVDFEVRRYAGCYFIAA